MNDLFGQDISKKSLRGRYGMPPFSVLDTRQGVWQSRRKRWLRLGIQSELGRNESAGAFFSKGLKKLLNKTGKSERLQQGISIFDPMLCEIMYKWFCKPKGRVLDPFAGGSVRGIVAGCLGLKYNGIELNAKQVEANQQQSNTILKTCHPKWIIGDAESVLKEASHKYDFIFTCPPYMDLEVYSNDPADLSNMTDDAFKAKYHSIITKASHLLKPGRFACFVIGDVRDKQGNYKDLPYITKEGFYTAGLKLYNEMALVNVVGSACLRTQCFEKSRKVVRTHQTVLVFKKSKENGNGR